MYMLELGSSDQVLLKIIENNTFDTYFRAVVSLINGKLCSGS